MIYTLKQALFAQSIEFKNDTTGTQWFLSKRSNFILKINISCSYKSYTKGYWYKHWML